MSENERVSRHGLSPRMWVLATVWMVALFPNIGNIQGIVGGVFFGRGRWGSRCDIYKQLSLRPYNDLSSNPKHTYVHTYFNSSASLFLTL